MAVAHFFLCGLLVAQITTNRQLPVAKTNVSTTTLAGNWSGTQTNDYGQYPQAINFQLTTTGEFSMGQAAKGTYTFSNNIINGNYKLTSSGETISFTGNYDPATQKLNCTLGLGTKTTGQGKWVAGKNTVAQMQTVKPTIVKSSTISTQPAPPPATTTKSSPATYIFYYLTNVTVKIYTGNDNKEAQSGMSVNLFIPPGASNYSIPGNTPGPSLIFSSDHDQAKYKVEFKSNSVTTITTQATCFPAMNGRRDYRADEVSLGTINREGLLLAVSYSPAFFTDAWKIEKIEMTLEFKQENGTPHPTLGNKTITFIKPNMLLTQANTGLSFATDKFLIPISQ